MSTGRMDQGAGLRNRRMQVQPLPSTPPRRSSAGPRAPPSEGGDRTFESCRRDTCPCSSAEKSASLVGTRPWVRTPPGAPEHRNSLGVIRPDEEPVPKTGRGVSLWAFESPRSRTCRDGPEAKTPGPQPGERGSIPRRGTPMPGSRAARHPAVNRKAGVRTPPWQLDPMRRSEILPPQHPRAWSDPLQAGGL